MNWIEQLNKICDLNCKIYRTFSIWWAWVFFLKCKLGHTRIQMHAFIRHYRDNGIKPFKDGSHIYWWDVKWHIYVFRICSGKKYVCFISISKDSMDKTPLGLATSEKCMNFHEHNFECMPFFIQTVHYLVIICSERVFVQQNVALERCGTEQSRCNRL